MRLCEVLRVRSFDFTNLADCRRIPEDLEGDADADSSEYETELHEDKLVFTA